MMQLENKVFVGLSENVTLKKLSQVEGFLCLNWVSNNSYLHLWKNLELACWLGGAYLKSAPELVGGAQERSCLGGIQLGPSNLLIDKNPFILCVFWLIHRILLSFNHTTQETYLNVSLLSQGCDTVECGIPRWYLQVSQHFLWPVNHVHFQMCHLSFYFLLNI